jgi:plasmid stability protein
MANVTISLDDELLANARVLAEQRGTSLNHWIRELLLTATKEERLRLAERTLDRLQALRLQSQGPRWTRDQIHER